MPKHLSAYDALTAENLLYGSWEIHYDPLPAEFDTWLKAQQAIVFREDIGENQDD